MKYCCLFHGAASGVRQAYDVKESQVLTAIYMLA
jgi:hypothetical protein